MSANEQYVSIYPSFPIFPITNKMIKQFHTNKRYVINSEVRQDGAWLCLAGLLNTLVPSQAAQMRDTACLFRASSLRRRSSQRAYGR